MPAKEIKELRKTGRLHEALEMAEAELASDPNGIWPKRNISWVYLDFLKSYSTEEYQDFRKILKKTSDLEMPASEGLFYENLNWTVGRYIFTLSKDLNNLPAPIKSSIYFKVSTLFQDLKNLPLIRKHKSYSFLFKSFHRALKDNAAYPETIDWLGIENLTSDDYQKEKLPDGKEIISLAEQVHIAYAKALLPKHNNGEPIFDREKASNFQLKLEKLCDEHPDYQYPPYFNAKLLLALGNDEQAALNSLLPFARKKRNDFWVWEVLAEAFNSDEEKSFACYCKALTCKSPDEMLVGVRQKMAAILINRKKFNEAKTEIENLTDTRNKKSLRIPAEVEGWRNQPWYIKAIAQKSNCDFYKAYASLADGILFSDVPEENIIVEFVNRDRKILNFIASEEKFGFLKYDRFIKDVQIGDVLRVRFQGGSKMGIYQLYSVVKVEASDFKSSFIKEFKGTVKILPGKAFGFIDDVFIHPSIIKKSNLVDGASLSGTAIKSFNQENNTLGWKMI